MITTYSSSAWIQILNGFLRFLARIVPLKFEWNSTFVIIIQFPSRVLVSVPLEPKSYLSCVLWVQKTDLQTKWHHSEAHLSACLHKFHVPRSSAFWVVQNTTNAISSKYKIRSVAHQHVACEFQFVPAGWFANKIQFLSCSAKCTHWSTWNWHGNCQNSTASGRIANIHSCWRVKKKNFLISLFLWFKVICRLFAMVFIQRATTQIKRQLTPSASRKWFRTHTDSSLFRFRRLQYDKNPCENVERKRFYVIAKNITLQLIDDEQQQWWCVRWQSLTRQHIIIAFVSASALLAFVFQRSLPFAPVARSLAQSIKCYLSGFIV